MLIFICLFYRNIFPFLLFIPKESCCILFSHLSLHCHCIKIFFYLIHVIKNTSSNNHFWLDEFNPSAHAPVCMWFNYGVLNDFLKEWVVRMDELKSGVITRDKYFEWKINWPQTCDGCGKYDPHKKWRTSPSQ